MTTVFSKTLTCTVRNFYEAGRRSLASFETRSRRVAGFVQKSVFARILAKRLGGWEVAVLHHHNTAFGLGSRPM